VTENNKRVYKAPALEKGLEIIELLAARQAPMSMSQIASDLGRSKNEIFRMLSVLEQKNYIKKQDSGEKYGITNHLFDLGMRVPPASTLIEFIVPIMRQLAKRVKQSCHLSVRSGEHIVVIARVENPAPVGFSVRVGLSRNLIESASGNLFLAWMQKKDRASLIKKLASQSSRDIDVEALEYELKAIRSRGYVTTASIFITGITDISMPITLGGNAKIIASLTIPYAAGSEVLYSLEETISILQEVASNISEKTSSYGGF
jgi:DNA-binding IclR family transcriptional regulator